MWNAKGEYTKLEYSILRFQRPNSFIKIFLICRVYNAYSSPIFLNLSIKKNSRTCLTLFYYLLSTESLQ